MESALLFAVLKLVNCNTKSQLSIKNLIQNNGMLMDKTIKQIEDL